MAPPRNEARARAGEQPRRQQRRRMLGASERLPDAPWERSQNPLEDWMAAEAGFGAPGRLRGSAFERRGALGRAPGRAWRTLEALKELLGSLKGRGGGCSRSRKALGAPHAVFP